MDALKWALVWIAGAGAAGGVVNAVVTGNLNLLPLRVANGAGPSLIRPGLVVNTVCGAIVSASTFWTFAAVDGVGPTTVGGVLLGIIVGLVIGSLGARSVTDESDKRLLRAAACKAAASPAADPATIREMELATPHAVLKTAAALEPRRAHRR
jgi:hypothetical protein